MVDELCDEDAGVLGNGLFKRELEGPVVRLTAGQPLRLKFNFIAGVGILGDERLNEIPAADLCPSRSSHRAQRDRNQDQENCDNRSAQMSPSDCRVSPGQRQSMFPLAARILGLV